MTKHTIPAPLPQRYTNVRGAADFLGCHTATLAKMRTEGTGPRFATIRRRVIYEISDLVAYVEGRKVLSTSEVDYQGRRPRGRPRKPSTPDTASAAGEAAE